LRCLGFRPTFIAMVTKAQAGRLGGRKRSPTKAATARRNGALGGRPTKAALFARAVLAEQARLAPLLPDADPHDLNLVLINLMRPLAERPMFVLPRGAGFGF